MFSNNLKLCYNEGMLEIGFEADATQEIRKST